MYEEWVAHQLGQRIYTPVSDLKHKVHQIAISDYRPQFDHVRELAGVISMKVRALQEEIGIATLQQILDSTHKKAVVYGMLHQSTDAMTGLVRNCHPDLYQYLHVFVRAYSNYASAAEQSLMRGGSFDMENAGPCVLRILRLPKMDPIMRLRYASRISRYLKVLDVNMTDNAVVIGFKPNLTFGDFLGRQGEVNMDTPFTNTSGEPTVLARGLVCLTVPLAQDLMCITQVLKTIRRVQYEHHH